MRTSAIGRAVLLGVVTVVIGGLDYATGPDIAFSLFYMAPIALAAWHLSLPLSIGVALLATASWTGADFAWHGPNAIAIWNSFTRLGIYLSTAWLTSRVRASQDELHSLNSRLKELLAEEQLLARTDPLTGLPNRRLFLGEIGAALERSRQSSAPLAMAYIDFDRFKTLNDRFGHGAGDRLLQRAADVIKGGLRAGAVAARLGSDDFGVLLERCTSEEAASIAAALHDGLSAALAEDHRFRDIGVSIGVAHFDAPPLVPEVLIDHADAAMYCARARPGRAIWVISAPPNPQLQRQRIGPAADVHLPTEDK